MNPCYALSVLALFRATSSISSVAMEQKETYERKFYHVIPALSRTMFVVLLLLDELMIMNWNE